MTKNNFICIVTSFLLFVISKDLSAQDHQLFTDILQNYVVNGLVDYKNLKNDNRLDKYLSTLSNTDPDKLNWDEKLAFWINAYNAFTLQIVTANYPIESITDLNTGGKIIAYLLGDTVWDKEFITINNKKYSLNDIEHKILRKMNEPRIHFAIVCASISCPELLNEAFESKTLEKQLELQTINFINDDSRNDFDLKKRQANISEIFNWFDDDFGDSDENVLMFISKYVPENTSLDIKSNVTEWNTSYNDYNWNLNELK
jgi:hypothetical protein